ncbi:probable 3-hydroxyisobutyrate dehydrogenase, mitochondrial isoform X2 [Nymphaea colorata]|uniref:probable 3-hydroxyisobutyrate dehydrogenase, mitochondrial isoform X2 n=1 Tax=Nymphaea colorata TaxID=210225 RepID=UPI00129E36DB|nr:probable 3-hydroxyisobutyrate dehydrogenase, mitochondrial isoform X2 [Nymphaea colorata]
MASLILPRARASLPLFLLVGHLSRPISSPSPSRSASNRRFSSGPVPPQLKNVGFIGVGNMGSHMANNLIKAGYTLSVHDISISVNNSVSSRFCFWYRDSNVLEKFSKMGICTAKTSYEIIESSDVVITMLPSTSHVMDVYTGPNGFLNGQNALRPWLFIDSSTVDPLTSRSISATVSKSILKEKKGHGDHPVMLDAPVSGGVNGAEAGTLTFMVGGPEEAYLAAQPLFLSMGKVSIYCGGSGNGVAAKICNNLAMAVSMAGVSEAYALGQSLGITAKTLAKIFNSSSARCWSSDSYNPVPGIMEGVPSSRNYEGGFSCKLMAKDLGLASAAAQEVGFRSPLTSQLYEIYMETCGKGHSGKDFSCIFRHHYAGKDEK